MGEVVLAARGLSKTYGQGESAVRVLHGLDLEVRAGEYLVVMGPSGCGKSTLLNILGLMDEPDTGEVLYLDKPASKEGEDGRASLRNRHLGFVFQFDSMLPEFTILENVTMPARIGTPDGERGANAARARALELLQSLRLEHIKDRFPSQVSGGERQRAALCRALINKPDVLLSDEPTGNLDKHNGELVFKDLKSLAERHGVAVVMVTHNEGAGSYASRVLHMLDGAFEYPSERVA